MSDFSTDFDPRSVGWWQRRSVIRRLKRTPWLTGADRDLRVQRARAAQSRGELNALTRDLAFGVPAPTTQAYGQAPQPYVQPPQGYGQAPQPSQTQPAMPRPPQATAAPRKRSLRTSLLVGGLVLLVTCGGGLVSCVGAIVDSVSEVTSSQTAVADDLLSESGWSTMVAEIDDSVGVGNVVDAIVRRDAATVTLPDGDDAVLHHYYDGDLNATDNAVRDPGRALFDLTLVEGPVVEDAVDRARQRAGVVDSAEAFVYVSATEKDRPTLMVTFPDELGSYSLVVDLDGAIVSEDPVS